MAVAVLGGPREPSPFFFLVRGAVPHAYARGSFCLKAFRPCVVLICMCTRSVFSVHRLPVFSVHRLPVFSVHRLPVFSVHRKPVFSVQYSVFIVYQYSVLYIVGD